MLDSNSVEFLDRLSTWLNEENSVKSVVLFGSYARESSGASAADEWSDYDLHVITTNPGLILRTDWQRVLPFCHFCLKVVRPATGGMRKLTVLFQEGELDLVLLPATTLKLAKLALKLNLQKRSVALQRSLSIFATIMGGGYRFLKGQRAWGNFYARVLAEVPGFRISDEQAREQANVFLCDLLWVFQKLCRGELVAAQRVVHRSLVETNVILLHELRIRSGRQTFQQARRVEVLALDDELDAVQLSARLNRVELHRAAWRALGGLQRLMAELLPTWHVSDEMERLLAPYRDHGG